MDPSHTYAGMYPYPVAHPYDGSSMVDLDAPDLGQWPKFLGVRGQVTIMRPGDVLFIPRAWWAHIQAMPDDDVGGASTAAEAAAAASEVTFLEVTLQRGARARAPEAVAPYVGRVVEELAATCEGVAGARDWLRRIGAGTEDSIIDLATPLGYKRIRSATDIRDEIVLTIGEDADVKAFLEALIDGRMTPTPWLNANFREPLYLKGARLGGTQNTASAATSRAVSWLAHQLSHRFAFVATHVGRQASAAGGHANRVGTPLPAAVCLQAGAAGLRGGHHARVGAQPDAPAVHRGAKAAVSAAPVSGLASAPSQPPTGAQSARFCSSALFPPTEQAPRATATSQRRLASAATIG